MGDEILLGVPNYSEGRDERIVRALAGTLACHGEVLDTHFDGEHNRCVISFAGTPAQVGEGLFEGAEQAIDLIDMGRQRGAHPRIGAADVSPVVYPTGASREVAEATALALAERLGAELGLPVFLYGDLAASEERRERAFFRRGGPDELPRRLAAGEIAPDFGPAAAHPSAGATLVTARPPLVAFNLELDTPDVEVAKEIAAGLRESGGGPPGVRALGLPRLSGHAQVSLNIHDAEAVPLAEVVGRVRELAAAHGAAPIEAELVGLAPAAALVGYPEQPAIRGFDPDSQVIERRIARLAG